MIRLMLTAVLTLAPTVALAGDAARPIVRPTPQPRPAQPAPPPPVK